MAIIKYILNFLALSLVFFIVISLSYIFLIGKIDDTSILKDFSNKLNEISENQISYKSAKFIKLPFPRIEVENLKINNGINADKAVIRFNLLDIISLKNKIDCLELSNVYINPNKSRVEVQNYNSIVSILGNLKIDFNKLIIRKVWDTFITNSVIMENLEINKNSSKLTLDFLLENGIKFSDNSSFSSNESFDSKIKIRNDNFELDINRSVHSNKTTGGNFSLSSNSLQRFSSDSKKYFDFLFNNNIKSTSPIKVTGKISEDHGSLFVKDILVSSKEIEATGEYVISNIKNDYSNLNLFFNKLDINNLYTSSTNNKINSNSFFSLNKSNLKMDIKSNNIAVLGDKISNFRLKTISKDGFLEIDECYGVAESGGEIALTGKLESNKYRPKFNGKVNIYHPDFNKIVLNTNFSYLKLPNQAEFYFSSDLIATPIDFRASNFKFSILGQNITGNSDIKFLGGENIFVGNIDFEDIDINKTVIPGLKNSYNYVLSLFTGMLDKDYSSKYNSIRNFPIKSTITLNFDRIKIEELFLKRLNVTSSYDSGIITVEDFLLDHDNALIKGTARVATKSIKPQIRINLTEGNIDFGNTDVKFYNNIINYLEKNIDFKDIDFVSTGFINRFKLPFGEISNLSWQASDNQGHFAIEKSNFLIYGGGAQFSANILLRPFKISSAFGVDSVKLDNLLESTNLGDLAFKNGFASFNGQYSSTGGSMEWLVHNSFLRGSFIAKNVDATSLGLYDLIFSLSKSNIDEASAQKAFDRAFFSSTTLKQLYGDYEINNGIFKASNVNIMTDYASASSGFAINIYDGMMDHKTLFSFYPIGASVPAPSITPPVKMELIAKGNFRNPDKIIRFTNQGDLYQLRSFLTSSRRY
jgi:hypothetical protein